MNNQVISKLRAKGVPDEAIVDYMHFRELFPDGKFERKDVVKLLGCVENNIKRRTDALVKAGFATVQLVMAKDVNSAAGCRQYNQYTLKNPLQPQS